VRFLVISRTIFHIAAIISEKNSFLLISGYVKEGDGKEYVVCSGIFKIP